MIREGLTSRNHRHRHEVVVTEDGVRVESNHDHSHAITQTAANPEDVELGSGEGDLQARVPKYGKLKFLDRDGRLVDKGVNVGNEWGYRSYIEGGTLATAIWTFEDLSHTVSPMVSRLKCSFACFEHTKATSNAVSPERSSR